MSNSEQDSGPSIRPERRANNMLAFVVSFTFHVALLLILACTVFEIGKRSQGILINASTGRSDSTALDQVQSFELSPDRDVEDLESFDLEPQFALELDIESTLTDVGKSGGDALTLTSVNVDSISKKLKQGGEGRGASFFGAYAPGNRFVFVLDSSTSMMGDRWRYARSQLLDSLQSLNPNQEFFVICFDVETTFLFGKDPEKVNFFRNNDETLRRVKNWLRGQSLGPSTRPARALSYALSYHPDAIFLLSDGELKDNSQFLLRQINSNVGSATQIPIHTVHLFSLDGRETLKMIAEENGGTFTPIERAQLSQR